MWPAAINVEVIKPYIIEVTFDDDTRRRLDLESELWGEVFEPHRDPALFAQASIGRAARTGSCQARRRLGPAHGTR